MWPFHKTKAFLGIDIGAGGIKIVELREEKTRPVLFTYGFTSDSHDIHALTGQDKRQPVIRQGGEYSEKEVQNAISSEHLEKYSQVISQICEQARTVSKTAAVSLPSSAVFHALVTLPVMPKADFNSALRAEVKKLLPRPIEEMALDYQIVESGAGDKNQRILVNAVPSELVEFYSRVFQKVGIALDALETESSALARSLVGKDGAVVLLIDIGAERTNFFIVSNGVPTTHHSIEIGGNQVNEILRARLGVEQKQSEQIKIDLSVAEIVGSALTKREFVNIFMPVVDPIEKEIEYSFNLYLRQSGNEGKHPEKIVLTGGAALLPGISEYLSDKLQIKSYVGDPWARVVYQDGIRPLIREIGPRMSVAIGLALRNMV